MSETVFYQRTWFLYTIAMLASGVLSFWVDVRQFVINPDAICYLYSAEALGQSGWHVAMHLCPQAMWPFYSMLIFLLVKVTHVSYIAAAFFLDGTLSALSVVMFIAVIKELGGSSQVMWLAAVVILLFHEFNILRQDIIRDHGFWAFYLASAFFLLRYFRDHHWVNALAFSGSLVIATLFRIEGAVFLVVLPFLSWCLVSLTWRERTKCFFMLNLPLWVLLGVLVGWWWTHHEQTVNSLGRISEIGHQLENGLTLILDQYQTTKMAVSTHVLTHVSLRDASMVVMLLMVSWYVINVIGNLSWIYALLVVYAWITRAAHFSRTAWLVVMGYFFVNLAVTFCFFAENHFLAKRYLIAFSLILMFWVPFALERLLLSQPIKQRLLGWLAFFFIILWGCGSVFHFGHSKEYIREAGDWLAANVPAKATLYTNDYQVMYYSMHFGNRIFQKQREYDDVNAIAHGKWKQYDFLALLMGNGRNDQTAQIMQEIHLAPVQVFVGHHGSHVYIYQILHQERKP